MYIFNAVKKQLGVVSIVDALFGNFEYLNSLYSVPYKKWMTETNTWKIIINTFAFFYGIVWQKNVINVVVIVRKICKLVKSAYARVKQHFD